MNSSDVGLRQQSSAEQQRNTAGQVDVARFPILKALVGSGFLEVMHKVMSPGLMITDAETRIVWVNRAFEVLSGWTLEEIQGKHPSEFLHGRGTDSEAARRFEHNSRLEVLTSEKILNYRRDGTPFWVSVEAQAVVDSNGKLVGHVSTQTDVTREKELEERWNTKRAVLAAVGEIQSCFIQSRSDDAIQQIFLRHLTSITNCAFALFADVSVEEPRQLQIQVRQSFPGGLESAAHGPSGLTTEQRPSESGVSDHLMRKLQAQLAAFVEHDPLTGLIPWDLPYRDELLSFPIRNGGKIVAVAVILTADVVATDDLVLQLEPLIRTFEHLIRAQERQRERKQMERSLKEAQELLEETGRVSGVGGWEVRLPDRTSTWTTETKRLHEVPLDYEPRLDEAINFYAPEARSLVVDAVNKGMETGEPWDLELPFITAKGNRIWVRAQGRADFENGRPTRLFGTFQDITARVNRDRAAANHRRILELIASKASLNQVARAICLAVESLIPDLQVVLLFCGPDLRVQSGVAGSMSGETVSRFFGVMFHDVPKCAPGILEGSLTAAATADTNESADEAIPVARRIDFHSIRNADQNVRGGLLLIGDPKLPMNPETERTIGQAVNMVQVAINSNQKDEELRRSEARLREAQRRARLGYFTIDVTEGRVEWSEEVLAVMRILPDEMPSSAEEFIEKFVHPDDAHLAHQFLQQVIESPGEIVATELRCVVGDGTVRWVSCEATARRTEDGRIFLDGTTQDINDRKLADLERLKLQEHLLQGQKIESIGRLAGGIAHDFNNMLAVILGHSDVALSDESLPDNILKHFQAIQRAAERSADLTRQLLTFARRQMAPPQLVNLNVTIPAMLRMLERLIGKHIHLEWAPAEQNCTVYIDPSQADQIVANLVVNARDAIQDHGQIRISTSVQHITGPRVFAGVPVRPGRFVCLEVHDDGMGMTTDVQQHLFEPFFTTKPVGEGTGLGLATVFGIVQQAGGFISVDSKLARGTAMQIFLPLHANTAPPMPVGNPARSHMLQAIVLLVENNIAEARRTTALFDQLSISSIVCDDVPTAVSALQQQHGIELVVFGDGIALADVQRMMNEQRAVRPDLGCIVVCDENDREGLNTGGAVEFCHCLPSHFSIQDLTQAIQRLRMVKDSAETAMKTVNSHEADTPASKSPEVPEYWI